MIRLLKQFADWLDRRYPPIVKVTVDDYNKLEDMIFGLSTLTTNNEARTSARLSSLATAHDDLFKSVAAIKDLLAKGGVTTPKTESEKLRDQFVRGEFRRETARDVIEASSH